MSWNMSLSVLPDTDLAVLGPRGQAMTLDDAASAMSLGGAQVGAHVVLVDPFYGEAAQAAAAHARVQLYTVSLSGVSDTYAIEARGPVERLRVSSYGEVVEDEGAPLAAEVALEGHEFDEDAHLAVFEALLGHGLSAVMDARFYELPFTL